MQLSPVFFCFSGSSNLSSRSSGSLGPQHLRNSRGVLRIADDCAPPIKLTVYLASNTRSLFEIVQSARWLPLSLLMLDEFFDFELYFFTFSALMIFWSADRAVSISDHSRVSCVTDCVSVPSLGIRSSPRLSSWLHWLRLARVDGCSSLDRVL